MGVLPFKYILDSLKIISNYNSYVENKNSEVTDDGIALLKESCNIPYYQTISSSKQTLAKPIIFTKRVIRKVLKFLIEPAFKRISAFNTISSEYIISLHKQNRELQKEIKVLKADVEAMKTMLNEHNLSK